MNAVIARDRLARVGITPFRTSLDGPIQQVVGHAAVLSRKTVADYRPPVIVFT